MSRRARIVLIGLICMGFALSGITGAAASIKKSIAVLHNSVKINIDGKTALPGDNFVYANNVYVQLDKVSSALGCHFHWDKKKNIIGITKKTNADKAVIELAGKVNRLQSDNEKLAKQNKQLTDEINRLKAANGQAGSQEVELIVNPSGKLMKIRANPDKGFNYAYFLFIPDSTDKSKTMHLLVEGNNTGYNLTKFTEELTQDQITGAGGYQLANGLGTPFLYPAFPRPSDGPYNGIYTHDLSRQTMQIPADDDLGRIDLQLVEMIKDAQKRVASEGVKVESRVLIYGYSASSHFGNRFALLHPQMVRAVATGGINSLPVIPAPEWKKTKLRYPLGINDLKELTDIDFVMAEYKKIPQFVFMGQEDTNDTAAAGDCFEPQDTQIIYSLLGKNMTGDRWDTVKAIFSELGIPAQFVLYQRVGHWGMHGYIFDDVVDFFRKNTSNNNALVEIKPHVNPAK